MTKKEPVNTSERITWDLEALYHGHNDPRLDRDLRAVHEKAKAFVDAYKGRTAKESWDAKTLLSALKEYETIHEMGMRPYSFAYLCQSSDIQDPIKNGLLQKVKEAWNNCTQLLTFFPLALMNLPDGFLQRLANQSALKNYRNFLLHLVQSKPHSLSEAEENVMKTKALTGRNDLISRYDELLSAVSVPVEVEGEHRAHNLAQILALQHGQDRPLRERSFNKLLQGLSSQGKFFMHIVNSLLLDDHLETLKRGHPSSMHRVLFSHQVDKALIDTMMEEVERLYPLAHRYLCIRARAMGFEKLKITDLSAPLRNGEILLGFSKASDLLLQAAKALHPLFYTMMSQFFEKRWIDAELRAGKRPGAFCKCFAPTLHPFVSTNYSGSLRNVSILAHELGHGIHYSLCAAQSYLNFRPSPLIAEAASTFFEIILTQFLMKRGEFRAHLAPVLASHLDGIFTTVYRQNMVTRFEQAIHRLRPDHLLSEQEICQLWWEANETLFGGHVVMIPPYRWGWTLIPHIFRSPFYCYSYVFGNLLSMILYENYKKKGEDFLENIILIFSSGSNQAPTKILDHVGLRPTSKAFWNPAFQYTRGLIEVFETLSDGL